MTYPTLRLGDQGPDVKTLQQKLIVKGFSDQLGHGQDDGIFGTATQQALAAYQVQHKLDADGIAGAQTWAALDTHSREQKPTSSPARAAANAEKMLSAQDLRLAQSYLNTMGYFSASKPAANTDVVHGRYDERTQKALTRFAYEHGEQYHLTSVSANGTMLAALRAQNDAFLQATPALYNPAALASSALQASKRVGYKLAYETARIPDAKTNEALTALHPVMRIPALAAIRELEQRGISVAFTNENPTARQQETAVRQGASTTPPGASYSDFGLALRLAPADKNGHPVTNLNDPRWATIHTVMQAYGFAMGQCDGDPIPYQKIPSRIDEMRRWPKGIDGWKDIPADKIPDRWDEINKQALSRLHHSAPAVIRPPGLQQVRG